ncbi:MAG: protein translocase subunit SecD [Elusimicrobia bacterium]|nr:protein translocase subunit SecD [Elusimicrobiota bacterium]
MKNIQVRLAIIGAVTALGFVLLAPSVLWYLKSPEIRKELERAKRVPRWLIRLGLDLRGGTHLLMELDLDKLSQQADRQITAQDALDRAVEIIRNRVDQFGVSEPFIAKQGDRFIVVQLPGISDPRRAKDIIGKTALLEFRMVDDSEAANRALEKIRDLGEEPWDQEGRIKALAAKLLPKDTALFRSRDGESYYLLRTTAALTGAYLVNARVEMGDYSFPHVSLVFNAEGGRRFGQLTGANVGKNMAIVLDERVQSAPVIRERIGGGRAIIEGNFSMEDARDLALILRAGALPAPVRIAEERTVGPSLGEDSIRRGVRASLGATLLIFVFMALYYRTSGVVADTCLALNTFLTMAALAAFGATLTLPGLAGLALSIGMSVDANVLIFERIREELKLGKTVRVALDTGYERALGPIIDGNMTVLIAAAFLFQFGSGPVKGFAVTLTIGLIASMFTAVFVSRTLFSMYYESRRQVQTISI